jgi:AraC-like DNA-binding protein
LLIAPFIGIFRHIRAANGLALVQRSPNDSIRSAALAGIPELIARLGGPADQLLRMHGFSASTADDPELHVSYADFIRLLEECAREIPCADFGLRVARMQDFYVLGPITIVMRHSPDVAEAIRSVSRYLSFHTPGAAVELIDTAGEPPGITVEIVLPELRRARQINELSMFLGQRMLELLLGETYRALAVHFVTEPPPDIGAMQRMFGRRLEFGMPINRFVLRDDELTRPVASADAALRRLIATHIELARHDPSVSLIDRVNRAIRTLLPSGRCTLPAVADQLGTAPRSLQRELQRSGTSFRAQQELQQRQFAEQLLANPRLPLLRVATLAGFAEQSTFNRAFTRWTGEPPGRWRRRRS